MADKKVSKYFPTSNPPQVLADKPKWAKGAELIQEDVDHLSTKALAPRPDNRRRDLKWVRALAAKHTDAAIATLAELMEDKDEDGKVRIAAATALLDRAWGKAQPPPVTGADNTPKTAPEALYAKLVAVAVEVGQPQAPRLAGEVIDAEPIGEAE